MTEPTNSDLAKWNSLLKYDNEVAAAAEKLRPLGAKWVDEFAQAYLVLNDKTYLPDLVNKISAKARIEASKRAKAKARHERLLRAHKEERRRRQEARIELLKKLKKLVWGTRARQIAAFGGLALLLGAVAMFCYLIQPARVDASAIWSLDNSGDAERCSDIICLIAQMEQHGASNTALNFARDLSVERGVPAWATNFHKFGVVDMVAYDCIVPTCEYHGGFALVNGSPRIVLDTSGLELLQNSQQVRQWISRSNNCCFLTRYYGFLRELQLKDGTQRFVFTNTISSCQACPPAAAVEFAFDFSKSGVLIDRLILNILAPPPDDIVWPPAH